MSDPDGTFNDTADWRLLCLQHNDAAQLTIDSTVLINMSASTDLGAGYLQICRAAQLAKVRSLYKSHHRCSIQGNPAMGMFLLCHHESLKNFFRTSTG